MSSSPASEQLWQRLRQLGLGGVSCGRRLATWVNRVDEGVTAGVTGEVGVKRGERRGDGG